jgi:hypothetical protein
MMFSSAVRRLLASRSCIASRQPTITRQLHASTRQLARKDAQDKDSLKPMPNEYSKSASDDEAAAIEQTAFDGSKTSPEEQQASASREGAGKGVS